MIAATTFANETVAVFGLARSGVAAARSLQAGGADVRAWDDSEDRRNDAAANGVPLQDLYETDFGGVAALVLSPGVPLTHPAPHPIASRAAAAGTEIIGTSSFCCARSCRQSWWASPAPTESRPRRRF